MEKSGIIERREAIVHSNKSIPLYNTLNISKDGYNTIISKYKTHLSVATDMIDDIDDDEDDQTTLTISSQEAWAQ